MNSPRSSTLSMALSRFFESVSARNARISSGVGSVPMASRYRRRRKASSEQSGDRIVEGVELGDRGDILAAAVGPDRDHRQLLLFAGHHHAALGEDLEPRDR